MHTDLPVVLGKRVLDAEDCKAVLHEPSVGQQPPSLPWNTSTRPAPELVCSVHDGRCDDSWCPLVQAQGCLRALARQPFSESRRTQFEEAYARAKPLIDSHAQRADPRELEPPDWWDTHNDPWARDGPTYPYYDGPYHVVLRPEPKPGFVWVTQPEEIEIEYDDGGPPKLREWQLSESVMDASYIELPWRVSRQVLESSGAHEAERRGDYVCKRLDRSLLPDLCSHCMHINSRCNPRCHPPHPNAGLTEQWQWFGFCSERCHTLVRRYPEATYGCAPCNERFCRFIHRNGDEPIPDRPELAKWKMLYDPDGAGRFCRAGCCSSPPQPLPEPNDNPNDPDALPRKVCDNPRCDAVIPANRKYCYDCNLVIPSS